METLQSAGIRIPDDVALASFDDIDRAQHTTPPLTTVRQQPDAVGYTAAERLIALIKGATTTEVSYVPTALIVRRSCGCASAAAELSPALSEWAVNVRRIWYAAVHVSCNVDR
jgi:LacI family transcriptional regulator